MQMHRLEVQEPFGIIFPHECQGLYDVELSNQTGQKVLIHFL